MNSRIRDISQHLSATGVLSGCTPRSQDEPIEWETAYSLDEILESAAKIEKILLPSLLLASSTEDVLPLLEEIREELKHIAYHIGDSAYFSIVDLGQHSDPE